MGTPSLQRSAAATVPLTVIVWLALLPLSASFVPTPTLIKSRNLSLSLSCCRRSSGKGLLSDPEPSLPQPERPHESSTAFPQPERPEDHRSSPALKGSLASLQSQDARSDNARSDRGVSIHDRELQEDKEGGHGSARRGLRRWLPGEGRERSYASVGPRSAGTAKRRKLLEVDREQGPGAGSLETLWGLRKRKLRRRDPAKCWSKRERRLYHMAVKGPNSPSFMEALAEYLTRHERCTSGVGDWTKFYMKDHNVQERGVSSPLSACKYLLWMPPLYAGLGNRILAFVSTFLYALLTGRTLLVGPSEVLAQIICNPFGPESASWKVSSSGFRTMYQNILNWQPKPVEFYERLSNGTVWDRRAAYADLRYKASYEEWKFYCAKVQEALEEAKFVGLHTDEYLVPGFYLVPQFKALLGQWFPDARPFMHTARFLVHPANYVWARITRSYQAYLGHFNLRLGVQVRTFYKQDRPTAGRILECAVNVSHFLPAVFSSEAAWEAALLRPGEQSENLLRSSPAKSMVVLVTSLASFHFRHLQAVYHQKETLDGTLVAVHSEGHEGEELVGNQGQYERALQEMWLLSFSDELLVSDASSFGYVAAGLAGVRPHSMNICFRPKIGLDWYTNGRPVCALAASSEPCYLAPPSSFQCPGQFKWMNPLEIKHGLQQCANIRMGLEVAPR